jgi:pSer/pThr/pTyr-binding forkhead associated (FHA) protein
VEPEAELPPDASLEITRKEGQVSRFPITKKTVTIGRDPECDLRLDDPFVSRKHCQIVFRGDHFTVIDLGSLNKTVVKGKQYIQRNLEPGTELMLGETRLRFEWRNHLEWRREHAAVDRVPPGAAPGPDGAAPGSR